jgi:cephalosporin-C deacetylase
MSFGKPGVSSIVVSVIVALLAGGVCSGQELNFAPFNSTGIYKVGEKVGWTATLPEGTAAPSGVYTYTIKKNDVDPPIKTGTLDMSSGSGTIEITVNEPAMLYVQVAAPGGPMPVDNGTTRPSWGMLGAAVAPEQLQPDVARPEDFDSFWDSKLKILDAIPANPVITAKESGRPGIDYATIQLDHINGTHVYGQIARPSGEGKYPGLVIFQWASPPYPLQKPWVTDRAAEGWLALNIEPHDVLPDESAAYYKGLPKALKNYQTIGLRDRYKNYFLQMYLADYRAVEYLASRPDWDGKTLVVRGTSMGGQQSLCVAGLDSKITAVIVDEPSGCDTNGPLHGRSSAYPFWPMNDSQVAITSQYFDPINFASHIKAPAMLAMGFVDRIAPPAGIWTAYNQIPGAKLAVPMIDSPHNHLATDAEQAPYNKSSARWLGMLEKREAVMFDQGIQRKDHNSQIAHEQLLEKAKSGHIDVYFEGDSITRRWGASDEKYKSFLANWKQNFFGWNAADFGWGGDTVENILWRLSNGELDNVNPKIIVLMAGTNNVGNATPRGDVENTARNIAGGIKSILEICREKSPDSTIVLMGITPRNDNMAVMPLINKINDILATFADGRRIQYVNINDKLADSSGKLYEGMTNPGDHLHLELPAYQIWADAIKPIFTEILGPAGAADLAPAATGDPSAVGK